MRAPDLHARRVISANDGANLVVRTSGAQHLMSRWTGATGKRCLLKPVIHRAEVMKYEPKRD